MFHLLKPLEFTTQHAYSHILCPCATTGSETEAYLWQREPQYLLPTILNYWLKIVYKYIDKRINLT